jgi:predicted transposase YdaD
VSAEQGGNTRGANPHDTIVQWAFSVPERAAVELRAVLPELLVRQLDFTTLRVASGTLAEPGEPNLQADVLYEVELAGREAYIYVVLEHQSSVEHWMALRVLGYVVRILERHRKTHPDMKTLPVVIPLVLHHSESGWTSPTQLEGLFEPSQLATLKAADLVPRFGFLLDDISRASDEELMSRALHASEAVVPLVLWALRDARASDRLVASLGLWGGVMARILESETGSEALSRVLAYISEVAESLDRDTILTAVAQAAPQTEAILMTLAEQWKQEGRQEGRQAGRQEGRQEGERLLLEKLLRLKFGDLPAAVRQRLSSSSEQEIARWAERVLTATLLGDVFLPRQPASDD